uniref:Uncharacterized protein n=1 Tax=Tanacetum cinerariifolium TaxID=118510 RepID=A0A699TN04_TANCI|nr:hypothetical protein [Tanacetum cinerariifolium]
MASAHNSSDPAPTCETMASVQISSDPAPECRIMALEHDSLSPGHKVKKMFLMEIRQDVSKSSAVSAADAPTQHQGETSSRHVGSSNMHTFYQHYPSEQRWTNDHPLE